MPYKVTEKSGQFCVVKNSDGKEMGCHANRDEAMNQLQALYAKEGMSHKFAFEPFATLAGTLSGKPFKILPVGKFYRGEREINITENDLKSIEANVKNGLPRYRIPINPDHKDDVGKIGNVSDVEYRASGEDGAGLYATKYELTDKGKKLVAEDGYDAPSAELVWTKNDGQRYQDPFTGEYHDNVLVGVAFTPRPFLGHTNVSLYSDKPQSEMVMFGKFKEWFMEAFTTDKKKKPLETPDVEVGETEEEYDDSDQEKGKQAMSDPTTTTETFDARAKVDELAGLLKT